jgi:dinuclear metal center YbgI/SA1388 family protein
MEAWACPSLAEEWDNIGLLVGDPKQPIHKLMVALDASKTAVDTAVQEGFDFMVTHHPLIYNPLKRVTANDPIGHKIIQLIKNNIGLYAAHTNLDIAEGGINDILCDRLRLTQTEPLMENGLGKVGLLCEPVALESLARHIKATLSLSEARFAGPACQMIQKIGICAGGASGMRYCQAALQKNCDVYITGDFHYHTITEANELGLCLIDLSHYHSEAPILQVIADRLAEEAKKDKLSLIIEPFIQKENLMQTIY